MICSLCGVFIGSPCSSCRTISRIKFLVESGKIQARDEAVVLSALRSAAGVLTDLAERPGCILPPPGAVPHPGALAPAAAAADSSLEVGVPPQETVAEGTKEEPSHKPKDKKRKKLKKEKHKDREAVAPGKEEEIEQKEEKEEEKPEKAKEVEEVELAVEATLGKAGELEATKDSVEAERPEDLLTREVNSFVEKHPQHYGLHSWPVRGTAGAHFERRAAERSQRSSGSGARPPEPPGPPPSRHHEERSTPARARSRSRRRGTKGAGHRERGHRWKQSFYPRKPEPWRRR